MVCELDVLKIVVVAIMIFMVVIIVGIVMMAKRKTQYKEERKMSILSFYDKLGIDIQYEGPGKILNALKKTEEENEYS